MLEYFKLSDIILDIKSRPGYWITMLLALTGAYLSSDSLAAMRGLGFFVWLFSNGYLVLHFDREKNAPMVLQFFLYEVFNLRGLINNWFPQYSW
jgi:hypothetical protein